MYPIVRPYVGQRVTVFNRGIGTISHILKAKGPNIKVVFDEGGKHIFMQSEVFALIPGNDDGYFDGPVGYVCAT